jgi:hypothetical protein
MPTWSGARGVHKSGHGEVGQDLRSCRWRHAMVEVVKERLEVGDLEAEEGEGDD